MAFQFSDEVCVICHDLFTDDHTVKPVRVQKGREKLKLCSVQRGDSMLSDYLDSESQIVNVRESCRRRYVNDEPLQQKRTGDEIGKTMQNAGFHCREV